MPVFRTGRVTGEGGQRDRKGETDKQKETEGGRQINRESERERFTDKRTER